MTLYKINEDIHELIESNVDHETGELLADIEFKLNQLELSKNKKIQNIGLYIKNIISFEKAINDEIKTLKAKQIVVKNQIERLKQYLIDNLEIGQKYDFENLLVSWRKSKSLKIDDGFDIYNFEKQYPELIKTVKSLKKDETKKMLTDNSDIGIKGLKLQEKQNIQIK